MAIQYKHFYYQVLRRLCHNYESKIFYLHDVYDTVPYSTFNPSTSIDRFREIVSTINNCGFEIVRDITRREGQVKICLDDGFRGIWDCRNYFKRERIYPTVFLVTSFISHDGYLTEEEIKELSDIGFSFQSHTVHHISITDSRFTDEQISTELLESKEYLALLTGNIIDGICLPRGHYNLQRLHLVKKYYSTVYSSIPGSISTTLPEGMIARNLIQGLDDVEIEASLFGAQSLLAPYYRSLHRK